MGGDVTLDTVAGILEDQYSREILAAASREPIAARELATTVSADPSTVYRRLDRLEEFDLVTSHIRPTTSGHHYSVYRTRLQRVTVELDAGEYHITIERVSRDPADRLTNLFEEIR